jgi:PIN domain nuclease of toxin-antitoxin system
VGGGASIVLDTHALIYDALPPARLSARARKAIAFADRELACSDISLWEIAMLIARKRLDPVIDARQFLDDMIAARHVRVLLITAEIAVLSQSDAFSHGDPADRLIAATARLHRATLITSDAKLRKLKEVANLVRHPIIASANRPERQ